MSGIAAYIGFFLICDIWFGVGMDPIVRMTESSVVVEWGAQWREVRAAVNKVVADAALRGAGAPARRGGHNCYEETGGG